MGQDYEFVIVGYREDKKWPETTEWIEHGSNTQSAVSGLKNGLRRIPYKHCTVLQKKFYGEARACFKNAWHNIEIPFGTNNSQTDELMHRCLSEGFHALTTDQQMVQILEDTFSKTKRVKTVVNKQAWTMAMAMAMAITNCVVIPTTTRVIVGIISKMQANVRQDENQAANANLRPTTTRTNFLGSWQRQ